MSHKVILIILIFFCLGLGVYFTYFRRPPTADILAANLMKAGGSDGGSYDGDSYSDDDDDEFVRSERDWNRWVESMQFVSIGKLYDSCNETIKRMSVGRIVMLPDMERGGVTSRTYLNVTLARDITGGKLYLTAMYNLNELYSSNWDLCTMEEEEAKKAFVCPVRRGRRKFVKQIKIPNYLPKGKYKTKAWIVDQEGVSLGCGYAEFSI